MYTDEFSVQLNASKWPQPSSYTTFHYLRMGVLFSLLFWSVIGCGPPASWDITPSDPSSCNIIQLLREQKQYQQPSAYDDPSQGKAYTQDPTLRSPYRHLLRKGNELGCLVLRSLSQSEPEKIIQTTAVALNQDGKLSARNATSGQYTDPIRWDVAPTATEKKVLSMILYILNPTRVDSQKHVQSCKDLVQKGTPNCFPTDDKQKKSSTCWFYIKIKPKTPEGSSVTFEQLKGKSCQICAREICGNQKDDDCDGQVDNGCTNEDCHHPGKSRTCYTGPKDTAGKGICRAGTQTCQPAKNKAGQTVYKWDTCIQQVLPKAQETCNGLDDNCNGQTDEGVKDCCLVGSRRACKNATGCDTKEEVCVYDETLKKGKWSGCQTGTTPTQDTCDGKDNDCDGQVDEDHQATDCTTQLKGICKSGRNICKKGTVTCTFTGKRGLEVCDGQDNNCDGQVDELFPEYGQECTVPNAKGPCSKGLWLGCKQGKKVCQPIRKASTKELCGDNIDNDCNGKIDVQDAACACKPGEKRPCYPGPQNTVGKGACKQGEQLCNAAGQWDRCTGAVVPQEELCDGKDNDCDGSIDETFPGKGKLCSTFGSGPCSFGRLQKCVKENQSYTTKCVALFQKASKEICHNGIDDNCNGVIDEYPTCPCNPSTQTSQACSPAPSNLSATGACKRGTMQCGSNGVWGGCTGEILPVEEICDNKDNDCNGQVDEYDADQGTSCTATNKKGICRQGKKACINGRMQCRSAVQPSASDMCDGKDNDCDGNIDEDDPSIGKTCILPNARGECAKGTLSCKAGKWSCTPSATSKTEICNGLDDDCDGQVDNNLKPNACQPAKQGVCSNAVAICGGSQGWQACSPSTYFKKDNQYEGIERTCDGVDNDCDGQVDNQPGSSNPLTRSCYSDASGKAGDPQTEGRGACSAGTQQCKGSAWQACQNAKLPQPPLCDGSPIDRNCNGLPDDKEPECGCWGSAKDGSIRIAQTVELDTVKGSEITRTPASSRSLPDIVSYAVNTFEKQGKSITLQKEAKGIQVGDEVLLIHLQGSAKRVGTYELLRVLSRPEPKKLVFTNSLQKTYGVDNNTNIQNQVIRVYRVPHYKRVEITSTGKLTVSSWNGQQGGLLVLRAQEVVRIDAGGAITVSGKGYRGGTGITGNGGQARSGESSTGWPTNGKSEQGGGTGAPNGTDGSSGGGGSYGTAGLTGRDGQEKATGAGGQIYGPSDKKLTQMIFHGSGGGAGGGDSTDKGKSTANQSGSGGAGGGIILIFTATLNVSGEVIANGQNGQDGQAASGRVGAGGGGSGGSIHIQTQQLMLYSGAIIEAAGGEGGQGYKGVQTTSQALPKSLGGSGGLGRIDIRVQSFNGQTSALEAVKRALKTPATLHTQELANSCQ